MATKTDCMVGAAVVFTTSDALLSVKSNSQARSAFFMT